MRDFSWKYFTVTGDVDAYLLYRQIARQQPAELELDEDEEAEAEEDPYDALS